MSALHRKLRDDRRGSVAVEFALAGTVLITMMLGTIGAGLLVWTHAGLQATANDTARCIAIGAPACADAPVYAAGLAGRWVFPGIINAANVSVAAASTCNGASGIYTRVTITSGHWASSVLPPPLDTWAVQVTACHLSDEA